MKQLIRACLCTAWMLIAFTAMAQQKAAVQFAVAATRINASEVLVSVKAAVPGGMKIYGLNAGGADPVYSTLDFDSTVQPRLLGAALQGKNLKEEHDSVLGAPVHFFSDSVLWQQKLKAAAADSFLVKGNITYLYRQGAEYLTGEQPFKVVVTKAATEKPVLVTETAVEKQSLWWVFFTAFAGGLLALLTPCVYSMIPVTVSFFTKRSKTRQEGIRNALYYAASIITIFTLLGFLITLVLGPAALNNLATNWVANLVFFALFLFFGFSFLGAFEITLPAAWSTRADSKAGTGSFMGIFFMALTLVVVSFSCTGPIIGNLLVLASKGSYWGPLTGMFGFSTALALPFALFAFFPSKLNVLGKAGGWLNAVKVSLGFVELALALKFLSNADLAKGWRLLDREVFLSLWIVIFALLGLYLLGKLKLHHDDELPRNDFGLPYLSVTRLVLAITTLAFTVFLVPGLWGAPLKSVSAFLPPMGTQDFAPSPSGISPAALHSASSDAGPRPSRYYEQMKIYEPEVVTKYGMVTYFDYNEALAAARKLHKPLMLDFTGINCVNCRKMEGQVWSDPEVMKKLKEDFVIASLYVDVHNIDLQPGEQFYSEQLGKEVATLGDWNTHLQVSRFGANTQPYYFFLDGQEQRLAPEGYGYDPDVQQFIRLLEGVKAAYQQANSVTIK